MAAPQAPYIGKQGKLALDEGVFGERFHGPLVHEAVRPSWRPAAAARPPRRRAPRWP